MTTGPRCSRASGSPSSACSPPPTSPAGRTKVAELRTVSLPEILTELGELSLAIGENAQARHYFERVIQREPGSAQALAGIGTALVAERDFDGAEERFRAARASAPDDALIELGYA